MEAGLAQSEELDGLLERVRFAAAHAAMPEISAESALRVLAFGLKTLNELEAAARDGGLVRALEGQLAPESRRLLDEIAPDRIRLPGGRQVRVHYDPGQPPWIASRLQDFFGMRQTPLIARGAVPLVVRLLAPNNRPVQTTTDLAGFWQRLYPQLRKELGRRYPKHRWPENPYEGRSQT
jgi:ATP-dependent helicase HrpB